MWWSGKRHTTMAGEHKSGKRSGKRGGRLVEEEDSQQCIFAHDQQLQVCKFNMYYSDEWQRNELSTVSASFLGWYRDMPYLNFFYNLDSLGFASSCI